MISFVDKQVVPGPYLHDPCRVQIHERHTAVAGRPLWAGQFWFHTAKAQDSCSEYRITCKLSLLLPVTCRNFICYYLASTDVVVLLLHHFLDRCLFFICDKYKSPSLFCLWILWKLNCLNLNKNKIMKTLNITRLKDSTHWLIRLNSIPLQRSQSIPE